MDALVSFLTRRAKGGVARRDTRVEAVRLRFGRGTDCEVFLPDPRVLPDHRALIYHRALPDPCIMLNFNV